MKKQMPLLLCFSLLTLLLSGCSAIVYGSRQDLNITTTPPGAIARIGTQSCVTPCMLNIPRKERMIFIEQGRTERQYKLTRTRNNFTYLIGNILFGIFPGMIVDSATGAKISLDDVNIISRDSSRQAQVRKSTPIAPAVLKETDEAGE